MNPTGATRFIAALYLSAFLQPVVAQEEAKPLVVIDLRPGIEKEGTGLLPLDGKCNKDVFRIADVASDPLKVDELKAELTEQFGPNGDGKTLTVLNWSIYYNKQVQHKGSKFSNIGIQGYSMPGEDKGKQPGSTCSRKESAGGWYQGSELTSVYFPLISEFQGTFAGKAIDVRVVYSPHAKLSGKFAGDKSDTEALLEAVHETTAAIIGAVVQ